ncbi:peptidase associated/transthyretin-like domain-containing protein [Aquimarina sp. M1]
MAKGLPFIFFLFVFANGFSQSQRLKGKIIADSLEGFAINIVNYTKKIGTTNDQKGYFEIPAAINDSIIFSSVQYEIVSLIVFEADIENKNFQIKLTPIVRKLDQVRVSDINLSGNIDKDSKDIEIKPFVNNKSLGLPFRDIKQPTQIERKIYTAKSGIIDRPINYLNGTLKKLKRIKAIQDLNTLIQKGENSFDTIFFTNHLGLPENLISDFMYYCAEDDYFENLLENTKKLSLLEFFQVKAKLYKAIKEID